ncbi:MAG: hypothetical protein IPF54_15575 [Draconibacterium sp.]|nr:hypothetical protein [Draconibacterium sp.]
MKNKGKTQIEESAVDQRIDRKQAIKRAGFYAVTAAGMITLLGSPKKSSAAGSLPGAPPDW